MQFLFRKYKNSTDSDEKAKKLKAVPDPADKSKGVDGVDLDAADLIFEKWQR